jgi:predicted metallopeptidase
MKHFDESEEMKAIADKIITERRFDYINNVNVRYLFVSPNISKTKIACCVKGGPELRHFSNADYLIEFSKDIWDSIDDQTRYIVMLHELKHILIKKDKDDIDVVTLAPHDITDFASIIKEFGVDWYKELKDIAGSTYELDAEKKDKIKI